MHCHALPGCGVVILAMWQTRKLVYDNPVLPQSCYNFPERTGQQRPWLEGKTVKNEKSVSRSETITEIDLQRNKTKSLTKRGINGMFYDAFVQRQSDSIWGATDLAVTITEHVDRHLSIYQSIYLSNVTARKRPRTSK